MSKVIVVMGVCGTGKTTVGRALANQLHCPFLEGDSFHPPANVDKMRAGTPLNDDDRWPWLDRLGQAIVDIGSKAEHVVAACSALKRAYRDRLRRRTGKETLFVLLRGEPELLRARLDARSDHYMPASLLESQLAILEPPASDEHALILDVALPSQELVRQIANDTRIS